MAIHTHEEAWQLAMQKVADALRDGMDIPQAADVMRKTFFKLLGYEEPQEETES